MPDVTTLTLDGTSLIDGPATGSFYTVIPDADSMVDQSIAVLRAHHYGPTFGKPIPVERVLTANCFITADNTNANFLAFDSKLDTLKQLLNTYDGTKKLIAQRDGWTGARYLNVHVRQ